VGDVHQGLPDQLAENVELRSKHATLLEFAEHTIRTPLQFIAGSKYQYSSMAILLAARVAEVISGTEIRTLIVWNHQRPTHQWFQDVIAEACEAALSNQPTQGGPCPLCGFPTFVWADPLVLGDGVLASVRHEFPNWLPEHGLCGRCSAVYRSRITQELTPV
jgi:hypothetical protein